MSWSNPFGTYHVGDVIDVLRTLPAESVQCVVTSPPYWALRDYGTATWEGGDAGCPHKRVGNRDSRPRSGLEGGTATVNHAQEPHYRDVCGKCGARRIDAQLGLEPTPEAYVARMVEVFREIRRVLRADGTAWVNLGDSYAGHNLPGWRDGNEEKNGGASNKNGVGYVPGLKPKDLVGIPWRVAFALQADGWWLRSPIVWYKPNPMPESVTDRPTKSYEFVFLLTKRADYFYDAEAIREPAMQPVGEPVRSGGHKNAMVRGDKGYVGANYGAPHRNARDVWTIATAPYKEAHFATFPPELVRRCILAGTSERGCCPTCGAAWERETSTSYDTEGRTTNGPRSLDRRHETAGFDVRAVKSVETTGWRPTCEHGGETPVPCTVLDPFMGSGTTALVAQSLNRFWVGIDLSPEYALLAQERCGTVNLAMAL